MPSQRVILVSSPIPRTSAELEFDRTADIVEQLRSGLSACWAGWHAMAGTPAVPRPESAENASGQRLIFELSPNELTLIRDEFVNGTLRPILHNRPDLACHRSEVYRTWVELNARLAKDLSDMIDPGDIIWVHDFHHIPLAVALRQLGCSGPIGLLLHAPFPPQEQLASLPEHRLLLNDLFEFDLVGFQTRNCQENFQGAATTFLDAKVTDQGLTAPCGTLATGVFQLPVNVASVAASARSPTVRGVTDFLKECNAGRSVIASMGTLDHAHGVTAQLRCFAAMLERTPELRGTTSLLQAIPGHSKWLVECPEIRDQVEQCFMHINGRFGTVHWTPIQYLHKPLSQTKQIGLYRAADVGLFLPFSEGVCLAAKDFVAAQPSDDPGVLVISRFAGGAEQLKGALVVNPYDEELVSEALEVALAMPLPERRSRFHSMTGGLGETDLATWARDFLSRLQRPNKSLDDSAAA
jgi:trehalose 6-phosphate synthase